MYKFLAGYLLFCGQHCQSIKNLHDWYGDSTMFHAVRSQPQVGDKQCAYFMHVSRQRPGAILIDYVLKIKPHAQQGADNEVVPLL
jgi:hypothetical protein